MEEDVSESQSSHIADELDHPFQLSGEVIVLILGYLDPFDILSMRRTCRFINGVTKSRIVWSSALERLCESSDMFRPSFPLAKMSNLELEHAATAPRRFLNLVKRLDADESPLPFSCRDLILRRSPPSVGTHSPRGVYLIPGGRLLLITTVDYSLVLWDLGHNMNAVPKPYPIATCELCGVLAGIRRSRDRLFVATLTRNLGSGGANASHLLLRINEIDLSQGTSAKFQVAAQLALDHRIPSSIRAVVAAVGVMVIWYAIEREFILWNWMEKTGCKWTSSLHSPTDKIEMYPFNRGLLTTDRDGNIYTWDMPDPVPLSSPNITDFPTVCNEPKARIPFPGEPTAEVHIRSTGLWRDDAYFCILHGQQSTLSGTSLSLYSVKPLGHRKDPFLPETALVPGGRSDELRGGSANEGRSAISNIFSCDDSLVFCAATSEKALMVTVLPVPTKAEFGPIPLSSKYLTPPNTVHPSFSSSKLGFCPMSGRLVFAKADGSVCLTDFLLPPSDPDS